MPVPPPSRPVPPAAAEILPAAGAASAGAALERVEVSLPDIHCAACIARVERAAKAVPGVARARANLSTKRLTAYFTAPADAEQVAQALRETGETVLTSGAFAEEDAADKRTMRDLVRATAVSGFASANIMLLSIAVWSGLDGAARDLFHWLSAAIALPTVVYAGRPFFRSAWRVLASGSTNMDVPISVGVIIATAMSLYETVQGSEHAWFDASVSLLFFLLIGRTLDHRMRNMARASALRLMTLTPKTAEVIGADGALTRLPVADIHPGERLRVLPGDRIPLDGEVENGASDVDRAWLTGESMPEPVGAGAKVQAGTMNLSAPLDIRVTAAVGDTVLAEIVRLMEAVERPAGRFVRLADKVARAYTPVVHLVAAVTFAGWMLAGAGWHHSLTVAVAVLIITCPCALGLAIPAVQIVATGQLLKRGVIVKDGAALERLAHVDAVVFDKTGTLTLGRPALVSAPELAAAEWRIIRALAGASRHPLARALLARAPSEQTNDGAMAEPAVEAITEVPALGVEGRVEGVPVRLGRAAWVFEGQEPPETETSAVWFRRGEGAPQVFTFSDPLRPDAAAVVAELARDGLSARILSGDNAKAVARIASAAGIGQTQAACLPGDKVAALAEAAQAGHKVLMVGDGLNDAPALAAAHVSMSPATGADITQAGADVVFTGEALEPVLLAVRMARATQRKIVQNLMLALGYNLIAVPIAILGHATPMIAAIAMSTSSIIVVGNAMLLRGQGLPRTPKGPAAPRGAAAASLAPVSGA